MNPLQQLGEFGQSAWLDYIRRNLFTGGAFKRLIEEDGLKGVTSNPTIFEKALDAGQDYDHALQRLVQEGESDPGRLFESLAIEDIRSAADLLRSTYDGTGGADGFVSMEVSPGLAHDTSGTITEARRLWKAVDRPNVMIKVPATAEGIPAIQTLTGEGINVNITLMFSLAHYEAVANAYLRGLERARDVSRISSVASFFVSRVDTVVDKALEAVGSPEALSLRGKIAIANAKLVYRRFKEIFHGDAFAALRKRGARLQRPLWASTGTKNPLYSDVLYVEELIGGDTVNTMPPATMDAFRNHGRARGATVEQDVNEAAAALDQLKRLGISLDSIAEKLQADGIASFAESFDKLMTALQKKQRALSSGKAERQTMTLGPYGTAVRDRLQSWRASDFGCRFWRKDYRLWSEKPVADIENRMGWVTLPETMEEQLAELIGFADEVKSEGIKDVVLLGMGGSSLAPEVFQRTFGNAPGYPRLTVLDSTQPAAVRAIESQIDLQRTLFLVSSKSGTTTEMLSFFRYFWSRATAETNTPGKHFVAITDPGTPLERLAAERGFRKAFQAPPDVGGRYAALTVFGLVPAALIGVDLRELQSRARSMAEACAFCVPEPATPCFTLGAALGELALAKRDKVTFFTSPALASFSAWVEQLIAESTGKDSKGIVPIAGEPPGAPENYGDDRVFVHMKLEGETGDLDKQVAALEAAGHPVIRIRLRDKSDLGQEFFRWETAAAAAGSVLGIHPFNQPDVELAKQLAREAMLTPSAAQGDNSEARVEPEVANGGDRPDLEQRLKLWLADIRQHDYIGLQAYLAPTARTTAALQELRLVLRDSLKLATATGYGPRFLHSTGQLHKGGPNSGVFLQLFDEPPDDLAVPETDYTFGALIRAQALGDYHALKRNGRRVLRVNLGRDAVAGLKHLIEVLKWLKSLRFSGTSAA